MCSAVDKHRGFEKSIENKACSVLQKLWSSNDTQNTEWTRNKFKWESHYKIKGNSFVFQKVRAFENIYVQFYMEIRIILLRNYSNFYQVTTAVFLMGYFSN